MLQQFAEIKQNQIKIKAEELGRPLTLGDLKTFVNGLTDDQLKCELIWLGDERGGNVKTLNTLEENYYQGEYGLEAESDIPKDDPDFNEGYYTARYPKGFPYIDVD